MQRGLLKRWAAKSGAAKVGWHGTTQIAQVKTLQMVVDSHLAGAGTLRRIGVCALASQMTVAACFFFSQFFPVTLVPLFAFVVGVWRGEHDRLIFLTWLCCGH